MIRIEDVWKETDGGRTIIEELYPESQKSFGTNKKFRIRSKADDPTPSVSIILDKEKKIYFVKDHGDASKKAFHAVTLISDTYCLNFADSLKYINQRFLHSKLEQKTSVAVIPKPLISNTNKKQPDYTLEFKEFTDYELAYLGGTIEDKDGKFIPVITSKHCADFNLKSVLSYTTPSGFKICSTEDYPIYYYDYKTYGKIYCPFGDVRFFWKGKKPDKLVFADNKLKSVLDKIYNNSPIPDSDWEQNLVDDSGKQNKPFKDLIICSGPSDAINVYARGYHVIWLNSETAKWHGSDYKKFEQLADNIYQLPDLDKTGKQVANANGLKFLSLRTIWLPEDLMTFKNEKGKPCKDVRDFFKFYSNKKYPKLPFYFHELVRVSLCFMFWVYEKDKNGKWTYGISNENLYEFLHALGYCKIDSKAVKGEFSFAQINNNIVTEFIERNFPNEINSTIIDYLKNNLNYYNLKLINTVHRSTQIDLKSLSKMKKIKLDFKTFGIDYDFFFFKNTALKITADGLEEMNVDKTGKYIYEDKIIDHSFIKLTKPFEIKHTEAFKKYNEILKKHKPNSPIYVDALNCKKDLVKFNQVYDLNIIEKNFSFIKFIYNTGRVHWEKEEKGLELTPDQRREHDHYFISKVAAIGYMLYRYKEDSKAWFLYCMETKQSELGFNKGGTGKSAFIKALSKVRKSVAIAGDNEETMKKSDFLFSEVVKDKTEIIMFDDIHKHYDLHGLLVPITGDMEVRHLYINKYTLPFSESPKLCGSTNHPLKNITDSLRRRIWFNGFCDYYHYADHHKNLPERSMFSEFGKNIITDYTEEEMNKLYNFFAYCLSFYLGTREKIEPPLDLIERRNLQGAMSDDFLQWAEIYFGMDTNGHYPNLNKTINKEEARLHFLNSIGIQRTDREAKFWKMLRFKKALMNYADYCEPKLIFNPDDLLKSDTEKKINNIREYNEGDNLYSFHFRTQNFKPTPDK